jgi:hypothetical protein
MYTQSVDQTKDPMLMDIGLRCCAIFLQTCCLQPPARHPVLSLAHRLTLAPSCASGAFVVADRKLRLAR